MGRGKFFISLALILLFGFHAEAQNRYAVYLKYKPQSGFTLANPQAYLTPKAIQRRQKEKLAIDSLDLPVSEKYIELLRKSSNHILYNSKWLNASILVADQAQINTIKTFPFVDKVVYVAPGFYQPPGSRILTDQEGPVQDPLKTQHPKWKNREATAAANTYDFQNQLIGIDKMHQEGFTGKGITIAVFDAGFPGVNTASPFAYLINNKKIIAQKNTVKPWQKEVFTDHPHGTNVLSLIGANEPGKLVSGAYDAEYILVITEDVFTEYWIEELNWVRGAEFADSLGVDIINSSLGYIDFDDASMTYQTKDLDGKTTIIAKGAKIASDKGILVVNSVGNYGSAGASSLISPADVKEVLSIGSVTQQLTVSGFSSRGPTADGRIKPDLAAFGNSPVLVLSNGAIGASSGTSFSGPQVAALAGGLWGAKPEWTRAELVENLLRSASQFEKPDNLLGYGIPDFFKAYYGEILSVEDVEDIEWKIFPNPISEGELSIYFGIGLACELRLFDSSGKAVLESGLERPNIKTPYKIDLAGFTPGLYLVQLREGSLIKQTKLIKK
ncbi:S8 family serine peptidase [Algoriphagus mannitolivorans]|uniref:S8 family serine peptidase n=1 Tax=Algoriphagus mannitolivorans TaxID=226504 RepID=UPI0004296C61|nr:S8 family serine peptidase [Algoriphagus mannitolivorans]